MIPVVNIRTNISREKHAILISDIIFRIVGSYLNLENGYNNSRTTTTEFLKLGSLGSSILNFSPIKGYKKEFLTGGHTPNILNYSIL